VRAAIALALARDALPASDRRCAAAPIYRFFTAAAV